MTFRPVNWRSLSRYLRRTTSWAPPVTFNSSRRSLKLDMATGFLLCGGRTGVIREPDCVDRVFRGPPVQVLQNLSGDHFGLLDLVTEPGHLENPADFCRRQSRFWCITHGSLLRGLIGIGS